MSHLVSWQPEAFIISICRGGIIVDSLNCGNNIYILRVQSHTMDFSGHDSTTLGSYGMLHLLLPHSSRDVVDLTSDVGVP